MSEGSQLLDRRGKHAARPNRTPVNAVAAVRYHIKSFPRQMSHYSRSENPHRRYLSPELSIVKMHQLCSPRTDTCKTCDSLKVKLDCAPIEEKAELTLRHEEHLKTVEDAYGSL